MRSRSDISTFRVLPFFGNRIVTVGIATLDQHEAAVPVDVLPARRAVRVPPELARRMNKLIPKIAKDPAVATLGSVMRSTLVKLAILKGVAALEQEDE